MFLQNRKFHIALPKKKPEQHFAVRFCGKEAFLKALGTGLKGNMLFSDIEFLSNKSGEPHINCYGVTKKELKRQKIKKISTSFSHSKQNAVAVILLQK